MLGSTQRFAPTTHTLIYGVTHIYQPPKHLSLAILMLDQDVPANHKQIQPISLPAASEPVKETEQGQEQHTEPWQISGWGLAADEGHELHEMLTLRVNCPETPQFCALHDDHSKYSDYELDAGAPLTKSNQLFALRSQSSTLPHSTFVDVASHVDWIQSQTGDGNNQNSSIWGILGLIVFTAYVIKCSRKSLLT